MDNQFTALDDFGIDNQLRPWDWFRACDDCRSFVDVLIRSRERIPIVVIVLVLLLDEVIQEVAIFSTNALSQRQGTRSSLGDHVSSCHKNRHVAHKSENRSYKEGYPPWFRQRKWQCAKEKNQKGRKRDVFSARIACRFRSSGPHRLRN